MIKVGQTLKLVPYVFKDIYHVSLDENRKMPCTVVYINRRHRYFTVEFQVPGGKFWESFKF